ncbi:hypothetical protein AMR72_03170 [Flavobacterium psychrophilum]|nr:hypothetical protein AMR72_03170 [Flavobacterium psychrophilum]AOE51597.1 hypothetical protein ALW18_03170 [Flavobacterium psychrophilum]
MEQNTAATDALLRNLQEREREQALVFSTCNALSQITDIDALKSLVCNDLKDILGFEDIIICSTDAEEQEYGIRYHYSDINPVKKDNVYTVEDGFFDACMASAENIHFDFSGSAMKKLVLPDYIQKTITSGNKHAIGIALPNLKQQPVVLLLFFRKPDGLSRQSVRFLKGIGNQLAITLLNINRFKDWEKQQEELTALKKKTEQEKFYAAPKVAADEDSFSGIVGKSEAMNIVFDLIDNVAYTESNVLIIGETGTGKELVAAAIHSNSPFHEKEMIKVNCAAIPSHLIESELFGHEKGSFTGATERRIGKFELANNSTIFLDEIGELPLELQAKMLRVLQEREIERIGGNGSIKVNVRIIAATNRNLQTEVTEGRFRSDLYYRLNVYPISVPSLRSRIEDMPLLSSHFLKYHAAKTGKKVTKFSHKAMEGMMAYPWPGNVRELENIIERNILLAKGDTIKEIHFPDALAIAGTDDNEEFHLKTLQQVEKEHILKVIAKCNGRISGPYGAAMILDMPATTLISKMQKLGIKKGHTVNKE